MRSINIKFLTSLGLSAVIHIPLLWVLFWGTTKIATILTPTSTLWQGGNGNVIYFNLKPKQPVVETQSDNTSILQDLMENAAKLKLQSHDTTPTKSKTQNSVAAPQNQTESSGLATAGEGLDSSGATSPSTLALIRKQIYQNKIIPTIGDDTNPAGSVKLGFQITPTGQVEALQVLKSSGSNILDQAALKSVQRAAPLPYFKNPIAIELEYQ